MKKQRYVIEKVARGQLGEIAKIPGEWHGVWLDDETLFALATLDIHEIDRLSAHPNCQVFASIQDSTPATEQASNLDSKRQANGLSKAKASPQGVPDYFDSHGVTETDTIGQAGLKIAKVHKNPHLEP